MANVKIRKGTRKQIGCKARTSGHRRAIGHKGPPLIRPLQRRRLLVCQLRLKFLNQQGMQLVHDGLRTNVLRSLRSQPKMLFIQRTDGVAHARLRLKIVDRSRLGIPLGCLLGRRIKQRAAKNADIGGQNMPGLCRGHLLGRSQDRRTLRKGCPTLASGAIRVGHF